MKRAWWYFCGVIMLPSAALADDVYRYVDKDGAVHYTDQPPRPNAKPVTLPPLSGALPSSSSGAAPFHSLAALQAAARYAVSVESPTPGESLSPEGGRVAAASVMPGLVEGYRLQFLLDGAAVTPQPVDELGVLMPALAPGKHRLIVHLIDPRGSVRASSPTVEFVVRGAGAAH